MYMCAWFIFTHISNVHILYIDNLYVWTEPAHTHTDTHTHTHTHTHIYIYIYIYI